MTMQESDPIALRIAVAQPFCIPGDVEGNLERMEELVRPCVADGARLILFAEGGVTGYEALPRSVDQALVRGDAAWKRLLAMATTNNTHIAAGFFEREGGRIRLAHAVFCPDGRVVVQWKSRTGPPEGAIEGFAFAPDERVVFDVGGVRCAIAICADSGIPNLWNTLVGQGVQLLLQPTAACGPRSWGQSEASLDEPGALEKYVARAATIAFSGDAILQCVRHRIALATCNQMADNGVDYFHPGHSMVVDGTGELCALIPGSFMFEHLRPRWAAGNIHALKPRIHHHLL
jgi:predicted amidohydrolase